MKNRHEDSGNTMFLLVCLMIIEAVDIDNHCCLLNGAEVVLLAAPQCSRGRLHFCAYAFGASPWGSMHVHAPARLVSMPVGF